jgi:hypothetical protein
VYGADVARNAAALRDRQFDVVRPQVGEPMPDDRAKIILSGSLTAQSRRVSTFVRPEYPPR